ASPADLVSQLQQQSGGVKRDGLMMESRAMAPAAAPPPPPAPKMAARRKQQAGEPEPGSGDTPIKVRQDFNPLAAFSPTVKTDADGHATVQVKMPDNLTRYRVMAVAVAGGKQFGMGESNVTARLPLMVRPSAPRFLNFGDKFELPVVVQNQTDSPMTVNVGVRTTNAELTDGGGRRVTVPANDRVE